MDSIEIKLYPERRKKVLHALASVEEHNRERTTILFTTPKNDEYYTTYSSIDPGDSPYSIAEIIFGVNYYSSLKQNIMYRSLHNLFTAHILKTYKGQNNIILICYGTLIDDTMNRILFDHMILKIE